MGLFRLPPAPPKADLNLDMFLSGKATEEHQRRVRRVLASEWFPQSGVQLTWPHEGTDWNYMLQEVTDCYLHLAYEIATREKLLIVAPDVASLKSLLQQKLPQRATDNIIYAECQTNDTWARDHGFLTVIAPYGAELCDFRFNGWGGKFEATLDNAINRKLYEGKMVKGRYADFLDFELEGGGIESDGNGTILTTAQCLLNPNRGHSDRELVEKKLYETLGADRVLWLEHGYLAGDDTDSHVDTLARFCNEDTIAYTGCTDTADEHYEELSQMEEELKDFRTIDGNCYNLVKLPLPDAVFDEEGERLPATYANFLIMSTAVLMPSYRQPEKDEAAKRALQQAFPKLDIVGVDCSALIKQHGSLHCATMQYPKSVIL